MRMSFFKGTIYLLTQTVIQSEAKNLANIHVNVLVYAVEILPPFDRLNDKIVSRSILLPFLLEYGGIRCYVRFCPFIICKSGVCCFYPFV